RAEYILQRLRLNGTPGGITESRRFVGQSGQKPRGQDRDIRSRDFLLQTVLPVIEMHFRRSVPELLVYHIAQGLALAEPLEIIEEYLHRRFEPAARVVGAVRREQNVLHRIERMVRGKGFCVENVERGAPNSLLGKRLNHCTFVDYRAAPHVDDDVRTTNRGKFVRADQAPRLF